MSAIRAARESDRAELAALWAELDGLHASLQPRYFRRAERPAAALREALADPHRAILVAAEGGALLGAVDVRIFDTPSHPLMIPRKRAFVDDLVVLPAARRRGLGRALMEAARRWADERGADELVLTVWAGNHAAERFYRSLGYQALSTVLSLPLERD